MGLTDMAQRFRNSLSRKRVDRDSPQVVVTRVSRSTGAVMEEASWPSPPDESRETREIFVRAGGGGGPDGSTSSARTASAVLPERPENGFADLVTPEPIRFLADVPVELRDQLRKEEMARVARRLETPLRALYAATSRKGVELPAEELRRFLLIWRQALGDFMGLVPDERTTLRYDSEVEEAYYVRGRCVEGTPLVVLEPCWSMQGEVVVRGDARALGEDW